MFREYGHMVIRMGIERKAVSYTHLIDGLIVSLKKHFVNKLTDGIIVKKNDVYL